MRDDVTQGADLAQVELDLTEVDDLALIRESAKQMKRSQSVDVKKAKVGQDLNTRIELDDDYMNK